MHTITAQQKNIETSADGAFIIMNKNCSLHPGSDCCHHNGTTASGDTISRIFKSKFKFPILNQLFGRQYLWIINVSLHYWVRPLIQVQVVFIK